MYNKNDIKLCKNCINCLIKMSTNMCRCKEKYWINMPYNKIETYSPYDFDCIHYELMD